MKPGFKLMTALLGILGIGDLAMVPSHPAHTLP